MKRLFIGLSLVVALVGTPIANLGSVASAATPGGVFVTGHDPDFHATEGSGNFVGAQNIIKKAIGFVTSDAAAPDVLLVSSKAPAPAGHSDSEAGLQAAGYTPVVASAQTGSPNDAAVDVATVTFSNYEVVVVASDFGGILRQADLDALNNRSAALLDYVNNGGGLVAFAETESAGAFDFLPFLVSEVSTNQTEDSFTVTPYGQALGLTDADVNGNFSHNQFTNDGGLNVVDTDGNGNIVTLATRGETICSGGVPQASISDVSKLEGNAGLTAFSFTVSLDIPACGTPFVVDYTITLGTASANDLQVAAGQVTFNPGESSKPLVVNVVGDTNVEPNETFFVNITSSDTGIADSQGLGTIVNDDTAPAGRAGAFACRASGLRLLLIEPNVANGPYNPCVDRAITTLGVNLTTGLVNVKSGTLVSTTDQTPNNLNASPPATTDMATAVSTVESADISALGIGIKATALRSEAKVRCVAVPGGLAPTLTSASTIANLKINGSSVNVNGSAVIQLPLGLGSVAINRTVTTPTSITQQALRVVILGIEVVVAEAKAGYVGNPCASL